MSARCCIERSTGERNQSHSHRVFVIGTTTTRLRRCDSLLPSVMVRLESFDSAEASKVKKESTRNCTYLLGVATKNRLIKWLGTVSTCTPYQSIQKIMFQAHYRMICFATTTTTTTTVLQYCYYSLCRNVRLIRFPLFTRVPSTAFRHTLLAYSTWTLSIP